MKRLSKRTLWISIVIAFVIAIGLIILCSQVDGNWTTFIIVLLAIDFIYLTIAIQVASFKTFSFKDKSMVYLTKDYEGGYDEIRGILSRLGYKDRKTSYGNSFLKIKGTTAYKCVLVDDYANYFNPEEEMINESPNKELEKCKIFVAIEIFKCIDEANLNKLPDFSIQGKNIYYTALLYQENNSFKCLNYVEPNEEFKEAFLNLLNDIKIKEVVNEIENDVEEETE